jgi:hypothetical protein
MTSGDCWIGKFFLVKLKVKSSKENSMELESLLFWSMLVSIQANKPKVQA